MGAAVFVDRGAPLLIVSPREQTPVPLVLSPIDHSHPVTSPPPMGSGP